MIILFGFPVDATIAWATLGIAYVLLVALGLFLLRRVWRLGQRIDAEVARIRWERQTERAALTAFLAARGLYLPDLPEPSEAARDFLATHQDDPQFKQLLQTLRDTDNTEKGE